MRTRIEEIAPGLYRISTYIKKIDLQFNQFLVQDDEPLLYHTGLRGMFPEVRDAVAEVIDPGTIRWIGFSHFEADECGSLNEWLAVAPHARPVTSAVGALVNINDFIGGSGRVLADGELLETGRRRFRLVRTPHVPHGWDAVHLFEETERTLFCSDLFLQHGDRTPLVREEIVEAARQALLHYEAGPLAHSVPLTPQTDESLEMLARLEPQLLAVMHGSSFSGGGGKALRLLSAMFRSTLGVEG